MGPPPSPDAAPDAGAVTVPEVADPDDTDPDETVPDEAAPDEAAPDEAAPDDPTEGRRIAARSVTPHAVAASAPRTSQRARRLAGEGVRSGFILGGDLRRIGTPRTDPAYPRIGHTRGARLLTFLKT